MNADPTHTETNAASSSSAGAHLYREGAPLPAPTLELRDEVQVSPCFADVFKEYAKYVPGLLRRLGVHPADADDVAQDVFIGIMRQLSSFAGRSTLKTWVCSICSRKAHDYRRTLHRRQRLLAAAAAQQSTQTTNLPDELLLKERESRLHHELARLPHAQREVFVLFEIEELTMKEVAAAVGCPLDTAYTRHRVARKRVLAGFERVRT